MAPRVASPPSSPPRLLLTLGAATLCLCFRPQPVLVAGAVMDPGFEEIVVGRTRYRGTEGALTINDAIAIKGLAESLCLPQPGQALRYAEVGSYLGLSATIVATACEGARVFAHDLFPMAQAELADASHPPPLADLMLVRFWDGVVRNGLEGRVVPMRGRSAETLQVRSESGSVGRMRRRMVAHDHPCPPCFSISISHPPLLSSLCVRCLTLFLGAQRRVPGPRLRRRRPLLRGHNRRPKTPLDQGTCLLHCPLEVGWLLSPPPPQAASRRNSFSLCPPCLFPRLLSLFLSTASLHGFSPRLLSTASGAAGGGPAAPRRGGSPQRQEPRSAPGRRHLLRRGMKEIKTSTYAHTHNIGRVCV